MTRGNRERALATLERIAKDNGKSMPLGKLVEPSAKVSLDLFEIYLLCLCSNMKLCSKDMCYSKCLCTLLRQHIREAPWSSG